ncbi:MFS transporter [Allobranchiibius huperziae]|uniref:EmrB/QacA subfamily drug resistance transporter n=1 Tax=Allobranchiibius huperziae TaxID=1874116 RepID=A0A853D852_9MICO|nr:MFS transporter [Allobranchiibius huperziae]NYJ73138.1 EmrB/QacA subfamily drug resistance transporter [Allobranchiibius huperziae]
MSTPRADAAPPGAYHPAHLAATDTTDATDATATDAGPAKGHPAHLAHSTDSDSSPSAPDEARHAETTAPGNGKWWTLAAVCFGTFMLLLDVTIVNVALPDIQSSLGSSFSDLQWVIDAYALTLASLLLTAGSLADIFGRRRLYIVGLLLFTAASALCGASQSTLMLQLSRGLQGVGGAVMFTVSLALLASAFHGKDRGTAFGIWGAITGVAVAIGPVFGGLLVSSLSWRWIFFVNIPVGAAALAITIWRVAESRNPKAKRPDWIGFVLFTASLSSLVYALIESGRTSFTDSVVVGCFAAAVVLMALFVVLELRSSKPMLDLSLFRLPTFSGGAIAAFGISAGIFSMLLYLTLYLQDVLRFSALGTGLRLLVLSGAILVVATVSGRMSSHLPVRFLIGPGLALIGIGLLLMRGIDASSEWTHLIPGMIVAGIGIGMVNPPLASTAVGVVSPRLAGMASGINSTFRQVGIATGIALLGTLFASRLDDAIRAAAAGGPLAGRSGSLASAVQSGQVSAALAKLPKSQVPIAQHLAAAGFTTALDRILLIAGIMTLVAAVASFLLIRTKDFHTPGEGEQAAETA